MSGDGNRVTGCVLITPGAPAGRPGVAGKRIPRNALKNNEL
jgi:hypothetical protein